MKHGLRTALSVLLLGLFIVAVGSLAGNLRLVDVSKMSGSSPQFQPPVAIVQAGQLAGSVAPSTLFWLFIGSLCASLLVVGLLLRSRRLGESDYLLWRVLGVMLFIGFAYGFIALLSGLPTYFGSGAIQELIGVVAVAAFATFLVFASLIAGLALFERVRTTHKSSLLERETSPEAVKKLIESIRKNVYSMRRGDLYRDSVIRCYAALTELLAQHGARDQPSFTPHELKAKACESLGLEDADIGLLTRLFEKARYAEVPVTRAEVKDSADALGRIADETHDRTGLSRESVRTA